MTHAANAGPHPDWIVPDWPVPAGVRALCSTRTGGCSQPPYDSFNLGDHVGDRPAAVAANRAALAAAVAARPIFLRQVHGTRVVALRRQDAEEQAASHLPQEADACWTAESGLACTIMVADCLPVLFATGDGSRVGAAHAGWRGLAGTGGHGVLEAAVQALCGSPAGNPTPAGVHAITAWLGPCIGPDAFEVGDEVKVAFVLHDGAAVGYFRAGEPGKWWADLAGLARHRLRALGVREVHGNDSSAAWCTVTQAGRFFSHRRDGRRLGASGRFAACVWRA